MSNRIRCRYCGSGHIEQVHKMDVLIEVLDWDDQTLRGTDFGAHRDINESLTPVDEFWCRGCERELAHGDLEVVGEDTVTYLPDGWAVRFDGTMQRPRWQSKGAAEVFLGLVRAGIAKPEPEDR